MPLIHHKIYRINGFDQVNIDQFCYNIICPRAMVVNFLLIIFIIYVRNALQSNHLAHDNKHVKHAIPFPDLVFPYFLCKIELTSKHKLVQTALSLNV